MSLLQKLYDLVARNPAKNDVTFCVGPEKRVIGAVGIILEAASPFFEREFHEKWETERRNEILQIPMPDFDPNAFELFVKLTTLDTWSLTSLNKLKLEPNQILNLLRICRHFEIPAAIESLEEIHREFIKTFSNYQTSTDFLKRSPVNLEAVLASDELRTKELEIFKFALSWAEVKCKEMKLEASQSNLRQVLGSCLFEIRFPLMSITDFAEAMKLNGSLTTDEKLGVYEYIASRENNNEIGSDAALQLPFKVRERKQPLKHPKIEPKIERTILSLTAAAAVTWTKLDLTKGFTIVDTPPFICDGDLKKIWFQLNRKIGLHGFGFLGPLETDSYFHVTVKVCEFKNGKSLGEVRKRIWAQKGKAFHFIYDEPLVLQPDLNMPQSLLTTCTTLYGAPTHPVFNIPLATQRVSGVQFLVSRYSSQLTEILFKKL